MDNLLVSDFDGTITRHDFYDQVCREFPGLAGNFWQEYEAGRITHFEGLRLIFAGIRAPEARLLDIIDRMEIDPGLTASVQALRAGGWDITVASAGCDWYIHRLLTGQKVQLTVYANPGEFTPEGGLVMRLPETSPFFSPQHGVDKVAVVREAMTRCARVAFAGDGRLDLAPALLVPPQRRFARKWLAEKLRAIHEPFHPFERWSDVAALLLNDAAPA